MWCKRPMKITPNGYKRLIDTTGVSDTDNFSTDGVSSTLSQVDSQLTRSSVIDRIQFQPPITPDLTQDINPDVTSDINPPAPQERLNSSRIRFMR